MKFKKIKASNKNIEDYIELLSTCFPKDKKFNLDYFEWLYFKNPNGLVLGFDAWDRDKLVGHYATIPMATTYQGVGKRTLLSLNTAIHPDYRKKGLFLKLARKTYEEGRKQKFSNVIGVANQQSTPGFINHLNFFLLEPLSIMIGFGSIKIDSNLLLRTNPFRIKWTDKKLEWRLKSPLGPYSLKKKHNQITVYGSTYLKFFTPFLESPFLPELKLHQDTSTKNFLRIYIGILPKNAFKKEAFITLPDIIKPVPLNLIYKTLDTSDEIPHKNNIFLNFLDFDLF